MALGPGTRLGAYEILSLLGSGGMGEVYRARDTKLGREVAVKVLPDLFVSDPERRARFEREARLLASLNHPHIAAIYGLAEADRITGIVLELVEGPTLADRLAAGALPIAEALPIARQIADAIEAAHEKRIVHRDLKPANIKLTPKGAVKVLDFGLATAAADAAGGEPSLLATAPAAATRNGAIIGTAPYMSPEQARGQAVDKRTDIWSFGCVLFEMLTGTRAYSGATVSDTIVSVLEREPDWRVLPAATPPSVRRLLQRCLEKDPAKRLHDIVDARLELDEALSGSPSRRGTRLRDGSWRGVAIAVGGAALAIAAAVFVWLWTSSNRTADPVAGKTRLVVLPFENLTRNAADDWLAGAFSDSLTLGFENVQDVIVVSRDRIVELYNQQAVNEAAKIDPQRLRKLTRTLGVRYYVHGTYQRLGDQIKVAARLVETDSGGIAAQESATEPFAKLLKVEDDLAKRFAAKFAAGSDVAKAQSETSSVEAYQRFVEGRTLYATARYDEAADTLKTATELDPKYAHAWALLSKAYARRTRPSAFTGGSAQTYRGEALTAATRAVALNPSLYDAHVALALASSANEQVDRWRTEAQTAIAINPRLAEAYELLGDSYYAAPAFSCNRSRDAELATRYLRRAIEIDPRFDGAYASLVYHLHWLLRLDESLQVGNDGLAALPGNPPIRRARSSALLWLNRLDEAENETRSLNGGGTGSAQDEWLLASVELKREHTAAAKELFARSLTTLPGTTLEVSAARSYFFANDPATAHRYLQRAVAIDPSCAEFAATTPAFAAFQSDPRFLASLRTGRGR